MHWRARKIGTKVCVVITHIFNYLTMEIYAWPFHDCTLNVWYLEKRKVSDTGTAEKKDLESKGPPTSGENILEIGMKHFLKMLLIPIPWHQRVSVCKMFNRTFLILAFEALNPLVYTCWVYGTKFYASPGRNKLTLSCWWLETYWSVDSPIVSPDWCVLLWRQPYVSMQIKYHR